DLFFRLNVFHIHLPALRDHKEDLPLLVEYLLRDINEKHRRSVPGVNADVLEQFKSHTWPGNIRELRNVLERATIACERGPISRQNLPADFGRGAGAAESQLGQIRFPVGTTVDALERELIQQTLAATNNNKTRAAEMLGISLKTLHNKLKEYESGGSKAAASILKD
ncbi:MAG: sigma-54-dependent Fis family transcriptional regulator, partial [Acidobacteria bacterium]|nr:sigma-54-dependent Fis family transcriptional regulator [Acidobacteriota bacterium]